MGLSTKPLIWLYVEYYISFGLTPQPYLGGTGNKAKQLVDGELIRFDKSFKGKIKVKFVWTFTKVEMGEVSSAHFVSINAYKCTQQFQSSCNCSNFAQQWKYNKNLLITLQDFTTENFYNWLSCRWRSEFELTMLMQEEVFSWIYFLAICENFLEMFQTCLKRHLSALRMKTFLRDHKPSLASIVYKAFTAEYLRLSTFHILAQSYHHSTRFWSVSFTET